MERANRTDKGKDLSYSEMRNKDQGRHFLVLGCGPSARKGVIIPDHIKIIGVNDSARFGYELSYHLLLDPIHRFIAERRDIINATTAEYLFTQLPRSESGNMKTPIVPIRTNRIRGSIDLENPVISSSYMSPFVGACIAYWLGAKTISFLGVDMINHPNFNPRRINQVHGHTQQLILALHDKGISTFNLGGMHNMLGDITISINDTKSLENVWAE